jgi:alpha-ketoglutarate-dependent taurine dioxygenase
MQYFRRLFTGFGSLPRPSTIPPITEAQAEALDALEFCADENCLSLDFRKGDIQYINNLSIMHARDSYRDGEKR